MSHLTGNGYGDKHEWVCGETNQSPFPRQRATRWDCSHCGITFFHFYHVIPNIHEAMKGCKIPEDCKCNE